MSEKTNKDTLRTDRIKFENMNFKILNYYPENNIENSRSIEKRLFDVFKKYEV